MMQKDIYEPEYIDSNINGMRDNDKIDILANYTNMQRYSAIKNDTVKVNQLILQKQQEKEKKPVKYAGFINKFKK